MNALHLEAQQALLPFHNTTPAAEQFTADRWIVKSILQKSIRRGDVDRAKRAAATLLQQDRSTLWRRLVVIAFEDIGIGCIEAVVAAVAATDSKFRRQIGDDQVLASLVALMCEAPKDRSSDYLAVAVQHPRLASAARHLATFSPAELMELAFDPGLNLFTRSLALRALWHDPETNSAARDLVIGNFDETRVPALLIEAATIGSRKTREFITLLVPLLWTVADFARATVTDQPVPCTAVAKEIPLYALDKHTRLGQLAIWRFAEENVVVRGCLARFVDRKHWRAAAHVAAFYVDAAPVARRLSWQKSEELELFGAECDLAHAGVPIEGVRPLIQAVRSNLVHLNEVRAEVLLRNATSLSGGAVSIERPAYRYSR
jgi:hypothetical protein